MKDPAEPPPSEPKPTGTSGDLFFSDAEPEISLESRSGADGFARPNPFAAVTDARTDFRDRPALGA
jgi:hypothetical protein